MNRISAPDGLPHSCAEMVRPSGVFTLIALCFSGCPEPCCPKPVGAIATRNAATVNLARRLPSENIVIAIPPYGWLRLLFGAIHGVANKIAMGCEFVVQAARPVVVQSGVPVQPAPAMP